MKAPIHFKPGDKFRTPDNKIKSLQGFRGQPELVKFPSTSEVFHAVLENSFYASCIDNGHGKTLEANGAICNLFGYTPGEMALLTTKDLFDTTEDSYREYLYQRKSYGRAKARITGIRKSGERFPSEITSLVFIDDGGEKRTINTIIDISKNYSHSLFE
jgi:PAS domain S-box-containing protein